MKAQTFTVEIPQTWILNANDRHSHWSKRSGPTRHIIQATQIAARRLEPLERATIFIGVVKPTRRQYDAMNLYPTAKACVDALVRLNKIPDDTNAHVIGPWLYQHGTDKRLAADGPARPARVRLHVRLDAYDLIPF